jgi:peptidyl-tRNA hydrolase, PTH1 family
VPGAVPADWLIVGLGNPGAGYVNTPHNVGFAAAEALISRWDLPKPKPRYSGLFAQAKTRVGDLALLVAVLEPQTFMNDSGRSVGPARGDLRVEADRILVLHDEIDTPFGEVRTKFGGGLAGHNGLKSIRASLGTNDFHRVRIGVGRPNSTDPEIVAAYVLGRFKQPADQVARLIDDAASAAERILTEHS